MLGDKQITQLKHAYPGTRTRTNITANELYLYLHLNIIKEDMTGR